MSGRRSSTAGGDDDVGERDQALGVDGAVGDDHRRQVELSHELALLLGPRQHDRLHLRMGAEEVEGLWEERIGMTVVERDVGRWAQDDEDSAAVDAEELEHAWVGVEVGEVVLLLEARVTLQLWRSHAESLEPLRRDRLRHNDARRGSHAELVLDRRELVVVCRAAGNAEPTRAHRQLV